MTALLQYRQSWTATVFPLPSAFLSRPTTNFGNTIPEPLTVEIGQYYSRFFGGDYRSRNASSRCPRCKHRSYFRPESFHTLGGFLSRLRMHILPRTGGCMLFQFDTNLSDRPRSGTYGDKRRSTRRTMLSSCRCARIHQCILLK